MHALGNIMGTDIFMNSENIMVMDTIMNSGNRINRWEITLFVILHLLIVYSSPKVW